MKTLYISLSALFVLFTLSQASAQENSRFRFDAVEHSFGDIKEEAGSVTHTFVFTNGGSVPLAIDRVVASCGCTTPEYPRTPVEPGEKARISVTFDPTGMPGEFAKSITVVSGGGRYRDFLTITGNVVPRPKSVEEQFPYDMGGGLRVESTILTFRSLAQGRSAAMTVGYINTSPKTVTLTFEEAERSGLLDVFAPETVCAGCRGNITFTYDLTEKGAYGQRHDVVRPVVDGIPSPKTIYTAMTGIDDFAGVDLALAPKISLDASFHDFGEVRRRAMPYTFRIVASNGGSEDLHIRNVSSAEGLVCTLRDGMIIAPGASLPFEVIFYPDKYSPGVVRESISIVVNDPMRPAREIRISAIIK